MDPIVVSAVTVFLAVTLLTLSLVLGLEWVRSWIKARTVLKRLKGFAVRLDGIPGGNVIRDRVERDWADDLRARMPAMQDMAILLDRSHTGWSLSTFLLLTLGLAAGFGLLGTLVGGLVPVGILGAALGALIPYLIVKQRARSRLEKFEEQLPDAIDLITRAIRAGHPLNAGLQMVAEETHDPIAAEFRRVFEEQRFGLPFDDALMGLADRVPIVDTRIMVTAMLIQREVGGNLAEVLGNLATIIRERFKIRRQLRVITAQGRLSGYVLAVMPIVTGIAIYGLNPEHIRLLFEHPTGKMMLVTAVVAQILGYLWIRRIVDIEI